MVPNALLRFLAAMEEAVTAAGLDYTSYTWIVPYSTKVSNGFLPAPPFPPGRFAPPCATRFQEHCAVACPAQTITELYSGPEFEEQLVLFEGMLGLEVGYSATGRAWLQVKLPAMTRNKCHHWRNHTCVLRCGEQEGRDANDIVLVHVCQAQLRQMAPSETYTTLGGYYMNATGACANKPTVLA